MRQVDLLPALGRRLLAYYEPHEVELWLTRPQPLLDGRTAIQVMAAGEDHLLHQVLDRLDGQVAT